MPDAVKAIYWDACVFLHYIEGTRQWLPILDALLNEASATGTLIIYTSSISIVEVAFAKAEKDGHSLDPEIEASIDAMWNDRSAVRLVEFNNLIARDARHLLRRAIELGRRLRPMDAIHLATAQGRSVAEFHTMDDPLKNQWQDLGFPVQDPIPVAQQPRSGPDG